MAAFAYRDASAYAPVIPSPLNPTSHGPGGNNYGPGRIVRRRRSRGAAAARRSHPASHTLTQRLLRVKAAEAWRGHVLSAQVAQYESAAAAAAKVSKGKNCFPPLRMSFSISDAHRIASGLRLPDLSCLKTRRMLLAMGLMGVLPALKVRDMLRQAEAL